MTKTRVKFNAKVSERKQYTAYDTINTNKYVNVPKKGTKGYDKLLKGDKVRVVITKEGDTEWFLMLN